MFSNKKIIVFTVLFIIMFNLTVFGQKKSSRDTISRETAIKGLNKSNMNYGGLPYLNILLDSLSDDWIPFSCMDISHLMKRAHGGKTEKALIFSKGDEYRVDMVYNQQDNKCFIPYCAILWKKEPGNDNSKILTDTVRKVIPEYHLLKVLNTSIYKFRIWFKINETVERGNTELLGAILISRKRRK